MSTHLISNDDRRADTWVGYSLLGGLWASMVVMVLGLLVGAIQGKPEAALALPLSRELSGLASGDPAAIVDLGILLLFAAPVLGVVVALVAFLRHRDMPFVGITVALLIILAIGFAVALH